MFRGFLCGVCVAFIIYGIGFNFGLWGKEQNQEKPQQSSSISQTADGSAKSSARQEKANAGQSTSKAEPKTSQEERKESQATQREEQGGRETASPKGRATLLGHVESVERPSSISGPMGTVQGPFALIQLTLVNHDKRAYNIVGFGIHLIDTEGNVYSLSSDAMGTLFHRRMPTFHMETIQPGMQKTAYVVFAMPADAVPDKLQIRPHGPDMPTFVLQL